MRTFRQGRGLQEPAIRPDAFSFWAPWAQLPHLFSRADRGSRGESPAGPGSAVGGQAGRIDPEIGWTTSSDIYGPEGELW